MDNNNQISNINIYNRKEIVITGVLGIINFSEEQALMDTNLGKINISGKNLELINLSENSKDIKVMGEIDSVNYLNVKKKRESIIAKLFK